MKLAHGVDVGVVGVVLVLGLSISPGAAAA